MSSLQDGSTNVDPTEVVLLEQTGSDGAGPPLRVSVAEPAQTGPASSSFLLRLQDLFDRTRPAVVGLVLFGAISASIAFAWQSRSGGDDSDLNEALANIASGGVDSPTTAEAGRSAGDFNSESAGTATTGRQGGTLQVAGSSERHTIVDGDVEDDASSRKSTSSPSRTTSTTPTSSTTAPTASPTTAPPTSTAPTTTATTIPTTASTTTAAPTTTEPPTTTTTEPPTTAPVVNPTGQFALVNAATGRCASGQQDTIDQQACGEDSNQTFRFESTGNDIRIVEVQTGLVLDVEGGSYSNGAAIIPYSWHGETNQRWLVKPVGSYHQIVSVRSGMCITVRSGDTVVDGRRLKQKTCDGRANQLWALS